MTLTSFEVTRARGGVAFCAALLLLAAGCGGGGSIAEQRAMRAAEGAGEVTVAAVWPWELRGDMLFSQGLDLAVSEVNAAGGIHGRSLRLVREDDRESVNQGRLVAQRLADDPEVMAVIGHLQSYVTVPAAAIYDLGGLVLLSPATTSAELTSKGYSTVFRSTVTDDVVGRQMAEHAVAQGYRRVAVYYERSIYGRALANAFEERISSSSATVVARDSYDIDFDPREGALEPMLAHWTSLGLDAVFLAGQVPSAGKLIAHFRRAGFAVPVLGGDAMSSQALITAGGDAAEGTVVTSFFHPDEPRAEVQRFVQAFQEHYGQMPDAAAALGYDAMHLLAQAMNTAPSPAPTEVARALRAVDGWTGVTGPFRFNEKGDLVDRRMIKSVVRNGRFEFLAEDAVPAAVAAGG